MRLLGLIRLMLGLFLVLTARVPRVAASAFSRDGTFSVATYNLENYIIAPTASRSAKSERARQTIERALRALNADVLALQEVGGADALLELRDRLRKAGLDYPESEITAGYDTNIQVALLSRFPITERHSHPDESFLLRGRRFRTSRGILEVDITVPPDYRFTLLAVHLKSRRESAYAPQEEIREQEAHVLRRLVDARLRRAPDLNLVVVGDFNDLKNSRALRTVLGRSPLSLQDTRPAEGNGLEPFAPSPSAESGSRRIAWTHYYAQEDVYSRVDYILVSRGMHREWEAQHSLVLDFPEWGEASDHRPVLARFRRQDR